MLQSMISISINTTAEVGEAVIEGLLDENSLGTLKDWLSALSDFHSYSLLDISKVHCSSPAIGAELVQAISRRKLLIESKPEWLKLTSESEFQPVGPAVSELITA